MSSSEHEGPSWLVLERYALGELPALTHNEIERQLGASLRARAMLSAILDDRSELPTLVRQTGPRALAVRRRSSWLVGVSSGLALSAALLLGRLPEARPARGATTLSDPGTKGGLLALSLFSELTGSDPRSFVDGERFKLFFTCPPGLSEPGRVLVFQAGVRYEPLPALALPVCGNQQPWPGAFSLTGDQPVHVCVAWGEAAARVSSPAQLAGWGVCSELTPAR